MKTSFKQTRMLCALALGLNTIPAPTADAKGASGRPEAPPAKTAEPILWSQIGAKAGADYQGDGLTVIPTKRLL
jgi:hypothetical protein